MSSVVSFLLLLACTSTAQATASPAPDGSPVIPTVITHNGEVTVSWQLLTHFRGVTQRLYAGDTRGFRLLAEGPAELGSRTYTYVDHARYPAPVAYQLRWVADDGREVAIATIFRVDARFSPIGALFQSVDRIDSGECVSSSVWCAPPMERIEDHAARVADLQIPSPEVPPPRAAAAHPV